MNDLGLDHVIQCQTSPLMLKFHNGSRIIFKGLDKPAKLKSINNISIIWIEECSEVKYEGFKELLGRLRHPTLDLHMILSTNPVGKDNWTYRHFFKDYHHPVSYIKQLYELKEYDPDLYRIARKGHFGINGIRVLTQFEVQPHEDVMLAIDHEKKYLYVYWEYYQKGTDDQTVQELIEFAKTKELIKADAAEPKTIAYFRKMGWDTTGGCSQVLGITFAVHRENQTVQENHMFRFM